MGFKLSILKTYLYDKAAGLPITMETRVTKMAAEKNESS